MNGRRQLPVLHGQYAFHHSRDPGDRIGMTDVGFYRSESAKLLTVGIFCKGAGNSVYLDGITQQCTCTMRLEIRYILWVDTASLPGLPDHFLLGLYVGSGHAH